MGNQQGQLITNSPQSTHEVYPQNISKTSQVCDLINLLQGFSTEQLHQLSHALSMISQNHNVGNKNTYANVIGPSLFSDASINSIFTKPWIMNSGATYHITSDSTLFAKTQLS